MSPHHGEVTIIPHALQHEPKERRTNDTSRTHLHRPQGNDAIIHTLINAFWKSKADRLDQAVKHIFLENNKSINALKNSSSIKDFLSQIKFTSNPGQSQGYEFFLHPAINSVIKEESSQATKRLLDSISDHHIIFTDEGKCGSQTCNESLPPISDVTKVKSLYQDALKTVGYGRPGVQRRDFEEHNCPFDPRLYFGKVVLPSLQLPSLHHVPKQSVEQNLFLNVDDISNLLEEHTMKYRMFLKSLDSEPSLTIPEDADTSFISNGSPDGDDIVQFSKILRLLIEDCTSDKAFNNLLSEDVRTIWRQHREFTNSLPPISKPNGNCMWSTNDSIDLDFSFGKLNGSPPKQEGFDFDRILKAKEILDRVPCLETEQSFATNDSCTLSPVNQESNLSDKTINTGNDKSGTVDEDINGSPIPSVDINENSSPEKPPQKDDPSGYGYSVSWSTDDCSDDVIRDDDGAAIPTIINHGRNMLADSAQLWPLPNQNEWPEESPVWQETLTQQQSADFTKATQSQITPVEDVERGRNRFLPGTSREAPDGALSGHGLAKQSTSQTSISDPDIYQSCVQESNTKGRGYKANRLRMKEIKSRNKPLDLPLHQNSAKDDANVPTVKVNDWRVNEAKDAPMNMMNVNATEFQVPNSNVIHDPITISRTQNLHFSQPSNRSQFQFSHPSNSQISNAKYNILPPIDVSSNQMNLNKVGLPHGVSNSNGRNDQVSMQTNRWGHWENVPHPETTKHTSDAGNNIAAPNQPQRFLTPIYNVTKPRQLQLPNNRQPRQQIEANPYMIPAPPPLPPRPPPVLIQQRGLEQQHQMPVLNVAPPPLPNLQQVQNPYLLPPPQNPTIACGPRFSIPPPPPTMCPPTQWDTQQTNNLTSISSKPPNQMQHMSVIQQQQQQLPPPLQVQCPLVTSWPQPPMWPSSRVNRDNLINIPTTGETLHSGATNNFAPTTCNSKDLRPQFWNTVTCPSLKDDKPKLDVNSPEFVPERMKTREELHASAKLPEITLHNTKNIQCVINEANKLLRQIYKSDSDNLDNKTNSAETPYQKLVREVLGSGKNTEEIAKVKCSPSKVMNESDIINLKIEDSRPEDTTGVNDPHMLNNVNTNTFQEVKTKQAFLKHIKTLNK